jgi:epoxide hydrolase 4
LKLRHRQLAVGRLTLHVAEVGEGEPVLFLHGFPAYWQDWEEQLLMLAARGYRAIAVDLPGYGESGQLPNMLDYRATLVVSDLATLTSALELPAVHVVGHDWGGTLAYCLAAEYPTLVRKLVILNAPHPELMARALRNFEQLRRSWYLFFFQLPWLPEWCLRRSAVLSMIFRGMAVRAGAFSDDDLVRYASAFRRPGVARAALYYYRAAYRAPVRARRPVEQDTLVLWGDRDQALSGRLLLHGLEKYVPRACVERFSDAGHWLHHDLPEVVSARLVAFLSSAG